MRRDIVVETSQVTALREAVFEAFLSDDDC